MKNSLKSPPDSTTRHLIINESKEDEVTKANPGKESIEEMVRVDQACGRDPFDSKDSVDEVKTVPLPPMSPKVEKRTSPIRLSM